MKKAYLLIFCLLFAFILTGCAGMKGVKTYTYEVDRVDQDLSRGNRGVIMGEVPTDVPERKSTRTMVGVDVILPPSEEYEERKVVVEEEPVRERIVGPPTVKPAREFELKKEIEIKEGEKAPVITLTVPPLPPGAPAEEPVEKEVIKSYVPEAKTYTIQKGDTLQKISGKFYGTTRKWPEIFEANKDALKHPSRIYPGQVITIPPAEAAIEQAEEEYK